MKYYLIAGEASGDLHASRLMHSLKQQDPQAEFRYFGGDKMALEGGTLVKHYRDLAYMGFIPVLLHLPTILKNMKMCKQDISEWNPDAVILVDYPGFNLDIAKYVHGLSPLTNRSTHGRSQGESHSPKVFYYIAPKIWAWKEYRIKRIKRDVDEMFSILPFEVDFFEGKHHYPIRYVGNPTKEEVEEFLKEMRESHEGQATLPNDIESRINRPIIALLAGSRRQEIKDNLPSMVEVSKAFPNYQFIVAGAPGIDEEYYNQFLRNTDILLVNNKTYALLYRSKAALVTSGTATLETALFRVPQVVCYRLPMAKVYGILRKLLLKVKYVSLVNLIVQRELVTELVADTFSVEAVKQELKRILPDGETRQTMLEGYAELDSRLGNRHAPEEAARQMVELLKPNKPH